VTALAIAGTQVVAATRVLEGYWGRTRVGEALAGLGRSRQGKRRAKMAVDTCDMGYLHYYLAFAADPARTLPTRLGNVLLAAESYSGDDERWGWTLCSGGRDRFFAGSATLQPSRQGQN
jgi:hypothetical protein